VPLGYEVKDRALVINDIEAAKVRLIYKQYLELGSVRDLAGYLDSQGIRSHRRVTQSGKMAGGHRITRGSLYLLLQNPVYIGRPQRHEAPGPASADHRAGIVGSGPGELVQEPH
jgi:site-specific DNA recombinase